MKHLIETTFATRLNAFVQMYNDIALNGKTISDPDPFGGLFLKSVCTSCEAVGLETKSESEKNGSV